MTVSRAKEILRDYQKGNVDLNHTATDGCGPIPWFDDKGGHYLCKHGHPSLVAVADEVLRKAGIDPAKVALGETK